jgi:hypothetical protein
MKIPKGGYTLEDVCRLAHMHKVNIHVGVLVSDFVRPSLRRNPLPIIQRRRTQKRTG